MPPKPRDERLVVKKIPFIDLAAQQAHLQPEIDARMQQVLAHGQYIMGPEVGELEQALSDFVGGGVTVGVSSGTDALLMALLALGIGRGDAVFVPTFTFTATAEVVLLLGAVPVFVDVCEDSCTLDPEDLRRQIAQVAQSGTLCPKAVIAVDL
ncbi:MAG TPA: aminotransferase DegT, partial [Alphaproteobacteria bacterium]|nr:aminotransferase DegT [Alphaproteobacteria bacterium]